jgi:ribosomal protein S8
MKRNLNNFFKNIELSEKKNIKVLIIKHSKTITAVLNFLVDQGFILRYKKQNTHIEVFLKKHKGLYVKAISSTKKKIYVGLRGLITLQYRNPTQTFLLHTTKGLLSHKRAIKYKVGGFLVCTIGFNKG